MKFRLEIARPGDVKVRIWMSRHGIFFVEFDGDGHVLLADGLGKTGRTRIEYPGWGWLRQVLEKRR